MNTITVIRGIEPDEENGGSLVQGTIIGARRNVSHWRIDAEDYLYDSRPEAEREVKQREMHGAICAIYDALGLVSSSHVTPANIPKMIIRSGKNLKAILNTPRFAKLLK